jgi:hypothetical protein
MLSVVVGNLWSVFPADSFSLLGPCLRKSLRFFLLSGSQEEARRTLFEGRGRGGKKAGLT